MHEVLLVDDDTNLLAGLTRSLHGRYHLHTATSGAEGLRALEKLTEIAVVVSDMRMPGMDGVAFLSAAKKVAPDAVRVMLTGNADQATAIDAINEGSIFRFVCKPCSKEKLITAIDAALRQHHLITAEREILEKTLAGSIQAMTEILSMFDERSFGKCTLLRNLVRQCAELLEPERLWEVETAAMLAPIGCVAIPPVVMVRSRQGAPLTPAERRMLDRVPEIGFQLLHNIPRLEPVANIVRAMGRPAGAGDCTGTRLLHLLRDGLDRCLDGRPLTTALQDMQREGAQHDAELLSGALRILGSCEHFSAGEDSDLTENLPLAGLRLGQITAKPIQTKDGKILIGAGQVLTQATLERLRNFATTQGISEPITVQRPLAAPASTTA